MIKTIGLKLKDYFTSVRFYTTFGTIIISILIGFMIMVMVKPESAFRGIYSLLFSNFRSLQYIGNVLFDAGPLILVGLGVGFAFKTGLFNIGASGQFMIGGLATLYAAHALNLPPGIHFIVAMIIGMFFAALYASIPGMLKAFFNVNEVITSIMLNYIAAFSCYILIPMTGFYDVGITAISTQFGSAAIPQLGMNLIFPNSYIDIGIIIAILVAVFLQFLLNKTTLGFELKAVGLSKEASKYAGIKIKQSIITSMVISGALIGMASALNYLPLNPDYFRYQTLVDPIGFKGISVALMGGSNPIGIIFSGIFISFIEKGSLTMQLFGYNKEIASIITSAIIYMIAISAFVGQMIDQSIKNKKSQAKKLGDPNV